MSKLEIFNRLEIEIKTLQEQVIAETDPHMIHSLNSKIDFLIKQECKIV